MAKKANPFQGRWRIVSMSAWDNDYLDEECQRAPKCSHFWALQMQPF